MKNIYITGIIGEDTKLIDVISQVGKSEIGEDLAFIITSPGGLVDEGFAIYNYIKNLTNNTETVGRFQVDSIATVIFQAGKVRKIETNVKSFVIHNVNIPFTHPAAEAHMLEMLAEIMRADEQRIADFYAKNSALSKDVFAHLMNNATNLKPEEVVALGLADSVVSMESVQNVILQNLTNMNILDFIKSKVKLKNVTLSTDKGEIMVADSDPIGKEVTLADGSVAPDGSYVVEGKTYVVLGGLLVEIKEEQVSDFVEQALVELGNKFSDMLTDIANLRKEVGNLRKDQEAFTQAVSATTKNITVVKNENIKDSNTKTEGVKSEKERTLDILKNINK